MAITVTSNVEFVPCGCGRSPTGQCLGWHSMTEEEFQQQLETFVVPSSQTDEPPVEGV